MRRITKEEIIQQLISFYFAGIDTTGHLVAFALYALAEYPKYKERIVEEIKREIKNKINEIKTEMKTAEIKAEIQQELKKELKNSQTTRLLGELNSPQQFALASRLFTMRFNLFSR